MTVSLYRHLSWIPGPPQALHYYNMFRAILLYFLQFMLATLFLCFFSFCASFKFIQGTKFYWLLTPAECSNKEISRVLTIFLQSGNAPECSMGLPVGTQNMKIYRSNSESSSSIHQWARPFPDNPMTLDSDFFLLMTHDTSRFCICLASYVWVVPNWEARKVYSYSSEASLCSK